MAYHVENKAEYRRILKAVAEAYREEILDGYSSDVAAGLVASIHPGSKDVPEPVVQSSMSVFGDSLFNRVENLGIEEPLCPVSVLEILERRVLDRDTDIDTAVYRAVQKDLEATARQR